MKDGERLEEQQEGDNNNISFNQRTDGVAKS